MCTEFQYLSSHTSHTTAPSSKFPLLTTPPSLHPDPHYIDADGSNSEHSTLLESPEDNPHQLALALSHPSAPTALPPHLSDNATFPHALGLSAFTFPLHQGPGTGTLPTLTSSLEQYHYPPKRTSAFHHLYASPTATAGALALSALGKRTVSPRGRKSVHSRSLGVVSRGGSSELSEGESEEDEEDEEAEAEAGPPRKRSKMMDMNMARDGSLAALPGFQTPLATYVAQMVVWLWYGDFSQQSQAQQAQPTSPLTPSSPLVPSTAPTPSNSPPSIARDPFDPKTFPPSRITPLMVHPSPEFSAFVARLLQITMVSHSVTLVALLYIYRLKMRNAFYSTPGSEHRPFVAALMLGNKYLDDNTYTNATWAELANINILEVNKMETEFLAGLNYQLGVEMSEYERWKMLLDEFMLSRAPGGGMTSSRQRYNASTSPLSAHPHPHALAHAHQQSAATSFLPTGGAARARSASPPRAVPQAYGYPVDAGRKRSAEDAFPADSSIRPPSRYDLLNPPALAPAPVPSHLFAQGQGQPCQPTPHLHANLPSASVRARPARPGVVSQSSSSALARSASLNRQFARMPSAGSAPQSGQGQGHNPGRRGSSGHVYATPVTGDISGYAQGGQQQGPGYGQMLVGRQGEWDGGRALLAPYDESMARPHFVPPEHLMFYSLAAEAHPGADGAPRKAILRYQDPAPARPFGFQAPQVQQHPFYSSHPQHPLPPPPHPLQQAPQLINYSGGATPYHSEDVVMESAQPAPQLPTLPSVQALQAYGYAQDAAAAGSNQHSAMQGIFSPENAYPGAAGEWSPTEVDPRIPGGPGGAEPAQFANAGPPGYAYNPYPGSGGGRWPSGAGYDPRYSGGQGQAWTRGSDGAVYYHTAASGAVGQQQHAMAHAQAQAQAQAQAHAQAHAEAQARAMGQGYGMGGGGGVWTSRSEWSSPMPQYQQW
ncbi:hypothetical protein IAT38_002386 [Cryptococcus sp. DSM 104549]